MTKERKIDNEPQPRKPRVRRPDTLTFTHVYEPNRERCIDALMILLGIDKPKQTRTTGEMDRG